MSYAMLMLLYAMDLLWLFLAFSYSFFVIISNLFGVEVNPWLDGRRAIVSLVLISCWFKYIYTDAYHVVLWLESAGDIAQSDIDEKAQREFLSLVTSIVNTLLIAGCKFKINGPKFFTKKDNIH
jgi:hypothetical protein